MRRGVAFFLFSGHGDGLKCKFSSSRGSSYEFVIEFCFSPHLFGSWWCRETSYLIWSYLILSHRTQYNQFLLTITPLPPTPLPPLISTPSPPLPSYQPLNLPSRPPTHPSIHPSTHPQSPPDNSYLTSPPPLPLNPNNPNA